MSHPAPVGSVQPPGRGTPRLAWGPRRAELWTERWFPDAEGGAPAPASRCGALAPSGAARGRGRGIAPACCSLSICPHLVPAGLGRPGGTGAALEGVRPGWALPAWAWTRFLVTDPDFLIWEVGLSVSNRAVGGGGWRGWAGHGASGLGLCVGHRVAQEAALPCTVCDSSAPRGGCGVQSWNPGERRPRWALVSSSAAGHSTRCLGDRGRGGAPRGPSAHSCWWGEGAGRARLPRLTGETGGRQ